MKPFLPKVELARVRSTLVNHFTKSTRTFLFASGLILMFSVQSFPTDGWHSLPNDSDNPFLAGTCTYKTTYVTDKSEEVSIPCDFPVKPNTGNEAQDEESYTSSFQSWNEQNLSTIKVHLVSSKISGIASISIVIPQSEFDQFSDERKAAIQNNTDLYSITK